MIRLATPLGAAALAALVALAPAGPAAAQCAVGNASAILDDSDVRATVYNTGQLFYRSDSQASQYVVPASGTVVPVYAAGFWAGGFVGGQLRVAGTNYGTAPGGFEYAPGPLDQGTGQPPTPTNCTSYDRIYRVSDADVAAYEGGGPATADLSQWPIGLGAPAVDAGGTPITTTDRTRVIDLAAGERPVVPGTEVAFWVMNDFTAHPETGTLPLGIEVQVLAFVMDSSDPFFDQASFYRYTIVNRGSADITNVRVGMFVDTDLGCHTDDYVGSDYGRGMIYTYNASNNDPSGALCTAGGPPGYGPNPPAFGMDLLQSTPYAMMYFVNQAGIPTNDPDDAQGYYNILDGRWKDGTLMTEGGFGYATAGPPTRYAFATGNPQTPSFWSERCINATGPCTVNAPGDRRMIGSFLAGALAPGQPRSFDLALVYARGANNLNSISVLGTASDAIQAAYDAGTLFPAATAPPVVNEGGPNAADFALAAAPNPVTGAASVTYTLPAAAAAVRLVAYDVLGREVAVLAEGAQAAGAHTATLEAAALPAGPYLLVLEADGARATTRVTVAR